jgi:hypothetical protein
MEDKKKQAKRYRLHYKIRKQGFRLNTKERTIYLIVNELASKQVLVLKNEFHYAIQLEYE